ncbi:hypothetical protein [Thermus antranikianii]|uniref:Uncharacterized protein n=1 Tax=Thermus antranikianii TaxID=88190 RepID=A0ABY7RS77_9DEIN|nr:hypothetical protein [Thermus antranikianii]WCM40110.1 hypothetical protein GO600_08425 [Thermus antranikianii]
MIKQASFLFSVLLSTLALAQLPVDPLDDQRFVELVRVARYPEAYALTEKEPARFAHWWAYMTARTVPPWGSNLTPIEAHVRATEWACRYREFNAEAAAFCYYEIQLVLRWKDQDPRYPEALKGVSLPNLTAAEAQQALESLAAKGVSLAVFRVKRGEESALKDLAQNRPYSLGGQLAAGALADILWRRYEGEKAVQYALKAAGTSASAAGVLAWGEYTGTGVKKNQDTACRRANFWAVRSLAHSALFTLGLCYLEGAGGFPKDPIEAYAMFWLAKDAIGGYVGKYLSELEQTLTPEQRLEGRRRAAKYFQ